jgi:hypothetical protein
MVVSRHVRSLKFYTIDMRIQNPSLLFLIFEYIFNIYFSLHAS